MSPGVDPDERAGFEKYRICQAYGWTPRQVDEMPPFARDLAIQFLSTCTATRRRSIRSRAAGLRWQALHVLWRHGLWQRRTT